MPVKKSPIADKAVFVQEGVPTPENNRLKEAFLRLPILPARRKEVDAIIEQLLRYVSPLAGINDTRQAQLCGKKQAQKELDAFFILAKKLYKHVNSMHKTTIGLFDGKNPPHPHLIRADLRTLLTRRVNIIEKAAAIPEFKKPKPHKRQAKAITHFLEKKYEFLTGKTSTRITTGEGKPTGPFLDFINLVFNALDIDASAASQIQKKTKK